MRILGIDPSLRSTGLCILGGAAIKETGHILTYDLRGMARLGYIADRLDVYAAQDIDLAVVEGYAMGVKGGRVFDIGEMGYAIKKVLYLRGIETLIVPPTSMKKFVTGKGNAVKQKVQDRLLLNWDMDVPQEDEADAAGLSLFGHYVKHRRLQRSLDPEQRDALQKFEVLS